MSDENPESYTTKSVADYVSKNVFDGIRPLTSYAALRNNVNRAVDAMIEVDNMWSHVSIPRLKRAWLSAIDALEAEAQRCADAAAARASRELSGRTDESGPSNSGG